MEMVNRPAGSQILSAITEKSEMIMAVGVVGVLTLMIVPLPAVLLDMLLSLNITCSLIILMVAMYIVNPLELSAFPSILLLTTLFRLSLNVASTRMILLHGNEGTAAAGKVIKAFGDFVVGGNYVVGAIVFIILVVINFVVITKGAGRIAEVAARFTLDAMPGKQMSIDADLNAGLINEEQARTRRLAIAKEADFYGAMDGASKFVRGDAVAGIMITLINIAAGLAIGVFQNRMDFAEAARNYTLLTVGDGLVSQIPALIISTAAGILVSTAASEESLGKELSSQLLFQPRAIATAAAVLFGFGLVPGLPTFPFIVLSLLAGGFAWALIRAKKQQDERDTEAETAEEAAAGPEKLKPLPLLDLLSIEVGYGLIPLVDARRGGELLERIKSIRRQLAGEIGIIAPSVHIKDNLHLQPGGYMILLKGNVVAEGELMAGHLLAMYPGAGGEKLEGIPTKEPTYGLPAYWVKEEGREKAISKGYTVVDLSTVLTTHLSVVIRRYAHEFLGRQEAQQLLDHIRESHPKVVEELVPNPLPLGGVVRVLQNLLREQVSIRDLLTILETLADWAPMTRDLDTLTEHVRQALGRSISKQYLGADGNLAVITLDQKVEKTVSRAIQHSEHGSYLALDPATATQIMESMARNLDRFSQLNQQPVVVCSAQIRSHFKKFVDRFIPSLMVLSYEEILPSAKIQSLGSVELIDAD